MHSTDNILHKPPVMDQSAEECRPAHDLEDGEIDVASMTATYTPQKVCFFWYHHGTCHRDPTKPTKSRKPCPHRHTISEGDANVVLSSTASWLHKSPCGLPFCPWKARVWAKKRKRDPVEGFLDLLEANAVPNAGGPAKRKQYSENGIGATSKRRKTEPRKDATLAETHTINIKEIFAPSHVTSTPRRPSADRETHAEHILRRRSHSQ